MPRPGRVLLGAAFSAAFALAAAANAQSIIYVDDDAPAGGDGASWATAYNSLHAALAAAVSGDEVRVAAGRYAPAGPGGSRSASFSLKAGVSLVGGYAGLGGADPDARDPRVFVTNLTGDLNGDDGADFTNISDNSNHILQTLGVPGPTTRIDGIHFSGGNATGSSLPVGAGIFINNGSPTIVSCVFTGNSADSVSSGGGAVCAFGGSPTFIDCVFEGNRSRHPFNTANGFGGAVYIMGGSFEGCTFINNAANEGGAVYIGDAASFTGCTFIGNSASRGGAIYRSGSGHFSATDCRFTANSAADGGAINFFVPFGNPTLTRCLFIGNTASGYGGAITNFYAGMTAYRCIFAGNSAVQGGGAVNATSGAGLLLNCTIAGNSTGGARGAGVLLGASNSTVELRNCILWDNASAAGTDEAAQIGSAFATGPHPIVNYTCVMGLTGALGGEGNIGEDPLFVDPANGDYSLSWGSPCIDAGDPNPIYNDADGSRADMGAIGVQNAKPEAVAVCQQLTGIGGVALVRLDGSGSSDPDNAADELTYVWTVDGEVVCSGGPGSCAVIEISLPLGVHIVTLTVTDPGQLSDTDEKTLILAPAALALLQATKADVNFRHGDFTMEGEISLPSTMHHSEVERVITAAIDLGGVTVIPPLQYAFESHGPNGDKWKYHAHGGNAGPITHFDVDWGGARFRYHAPHFPVKLQSDLITSSESVLAMKFNHRQTGAFTMTVGPAVISVAADGTVTANVPVENRRGNELEVILPFPITPATTFVFTGSLGGAIVAGDDLTYSTGRFRIKGSFNPALTPDAEATTPRTIDLFLWVGAEGYPGVAAVGPSEIEVRRDKWHVH